MGARTYKKYNTLCVHTERFVQSVNQAVHVQGEYIDAAYYKKSDSCVYPVGNFVLSHYYDDVNQNVSNTSIPHPLDW